MTLLVALALAGCENDQRAVLVEKRAPGATPTPTPSPASDDDARVGPAALTLDDLPAGWRAEEQESDLASCQPVVNARTRATGSSVSPGLSDDTGALVQSWVFLYDDEAIAEQVYVDLRRDDTRACLAETIMKSAPDGLAESYDVQPSSPDPLAEENEGGRVTITLNPSSGASKLFLDVRFGYSGRGVAMLVFIAPEEPFDGDLRLALVDTLAGRLKAALR